MEFDVGAQRRPRRMGKLVPSLRRREEQRELGADRYAPEGCQRHGISSAMRAAGCD